MKDSKTLFYVLVSFMPLPLDVITLKSLYIYIYDNKRQRKNVFGPSKIVFISHIIILIEYIKIINLLIAGREIGDYFI